MNRFANFLSLIAVAVFEAGLWAGLASFLGFFVFAAIQGYFLYGLLYGLIVAVPCIVVAIVISLGLGLSVAIVSTVFFPNPRSNETLYRFVSGITALIVALLMAFLAWRYTLQSISPTGYISFGFLTFLVGISIITAGVISQRLASRYIKSKAEKAKNSESV
jgi:hypothetical protein